MDEIGTGPNSLFLLINFFSLETRNIKVCAIYSEHDLLTFASLLSLVTGKLVVFARTTAFMDLCSP